MIVARSAAELLDQRESIVLEQRVAFVPTMGALHAGHRSLIRLARSLADVVVVSIFVNPLQFGPSEDYARYPRPLEADLEVCHQDSVALVFVPSAADLYPAGRSVSVTAGRLGVDFEGRSRPGHFDGVLTVVTKLFNLVRPDVAIFGQKDAQQLACIRRMVIDLNAGVEIVAAPIVREADGLAISSRNVYLAPAERILAQSLGSALRAAAGQSTAGACLAAARAVLSKAEADPAFSLDYLAIVDPDTFVPVPDGFQGDALVIVAAQVGSTRLIDNATVALTGPSGAGPLVTVEPAGASERAASSGFTGSRSTGG
jgi:pantoate--beta-alanine ligase